MSETKMDAYDVLRELGQYLSAHGNDARQSMLHADKYAALEGFWKLASAYGEWVDSKDRELNNEDR